MLVRQLLCLQMALQCVKQGVCASHTCCQSLSGSTLPPYVICASRQMSQLDVVCACVFCRVKIDYRPVHMKPLDDEMDFVPPKPRVY